MVHDDLRMFPALQSNRTYLRHVPSGGVESCLQNWNRSLEDPIERNLHDGHGRNVQLLQRHSEKGASDKRV